MADLASYQLESRTGSTSLAESSALLQSKAAELFSPLASELSRQGSGGAGWNSAGAGGPDGVDMDPWEKVEASAERTIDAPAGQGLRPSGRYATAPELPCRPRVL